MGLGVGTAFGGATGELATGAAFGSGLAIAFMLALQEYRNRDTAATDEDGSSDGPATSRTLKG